ncbi:MAG: DUF1934 domain-containing protein, partial [bacterium]
MDARIYVKGLSGSDEESHEDNAFFSVGTYEYTPAKTVITYPESRLTGMNGTETRVVVTPGWVVVERRGEVESKMLYEEGERHLIRYATPYGHFMMGIDTHKITSRLTETGGELNIYYDIDFNGSLPIESRVQIRVSTGGERL